MDTITNVVTHNKCSGCSACFSSCPKGAITMQMNREGFMEPVIDKQKCINCNLCNKVCPILIDTVSTTQETIPPTYAGWNKDKRIREQSSSGGIFLS